jgi:hypothetical protein
MASESDYAKIAAMMDVLLEQVKELRSDFREVHDRLIRLEAQNMTTELQSLEARLIALETDMHRRSGAVNFGESLPKYVGWFVAAIAAVVAYLKGQ